MNAQNFYQTPSNDKVVSLILLTKEAFSAQQSESTAEIRSAFSLQQFKGGLGEIAVIGDAEGRLISVYIGQGAGQDVDAIAQAVLKLPAGVYAPSQTLSMRAMVIWSLAQYRFIRYKKRETVVRNLIVPEAMLHGVLAETTSVFLTRDLINTPASDMHPEALIGALHAVADAHHATFEQWVGDELLQHNFPAVHAVGRAASVEPRIAMLTWGDVAHPHVTLVGKGVCFDSGGLDIKPSSSMRLMKKDMGGAAVVIGLANWLMMQKLPIYLQVIVPAVENAIGSRAFRPGDVLTMRSGLTVEIDNTDAEGRLILADALVKACETKPELLINFATLTGAARVAVGTEISALFTNDDVLAEAIMNASKEMRDAVWRMPLFKGYASMNDSSIADLSNSTSSSYAGAITAALFLERFIAEDISWAHFDTMAWNVSSKPGRPEGGEAMGMQAVAGYLMQRYG
jgi:leucyl aminopeptidase